MRQGITILMVQDAQVGEVWVQDHSRGLIYNVSSIQEIQSEL